jgi:hypothetical protein
MKAQVSGVRRVQSTLYVGLGDGVCRVSVLVVCVGAGVVDGDWRRRSGARIEGLGVAAPWLL